MLIPYVRRLVISVYTLNDPSTRNRPKLLAETGDVYHLTRWVGGARQIDARFVDDFGQLVGGVLRLGEYQTLVVNAVDGQPMHERAS